MTERRSKVYWVDEQAIFFLFVEFTKSPTEFVSIPTPINLPEGAVVEYCGHDPMRRGFAFIVSHPSFPIWENGAECPRGQDVLEFTTTRRMCVQDSPGKRLVHDAMASAERDGISYEEAMRRITGHHEEEIGVDPGHPEGDFSSIQFVGQKIASMEKYARLEEQAKALIADGWETKDLCIVQEEGKPDRMEAREDIQAKLFAARQSDRAVPWLKALAKCASHAPTDIVQPVPPPADEQAAMLEWFKGTP